MLSSPSLASPNQCRHDRIGRVQPRSEIRDRNTDLSGWAISVASDVHQTKFGFDHNIVAGAIAVWSGLPVACDAGVDDGRVDFGYCGVIHSVLFESAWEVILH